MDRVVAVVSVIYNVPYVRHIVLCEVVMIALGSVKSYYVILSTACYHQKVRLLICIAPLP